jgi:hypothetical protein
MGSATRDLPILAVDALHVARGEEDIHNTLFAGNGWLLTSMDYNRRDMYPVVQLAPAEGLRPVDIALAGAEVTGGHGERSKVSSYAKASDDREGLMVGGLSPLKERLRPAVCRCAPSCGHCCPSGD